MLSMEQLMYFDSLRDDYNTEINIKKDAIFRAQETIVSEQQSIKEVQAKLDMMVGILNLAEPNWANRLSTYQAGD